MAYQEIQLVPEIGLGSPAAIQHDGVCRKVLIDPIQWLFIPPEQREFIILHELAHCQHDVFDESEADRIAFQQYIQSGGCPEDAIGAIADNLDRNRPEVQHRIDLLHQYENMYPTSYLGPSPSPYGGWWENAQDTPEPDPGETNPGGWDWNAFTEDILQSAPGIIGALRGRNPQNPGNYPTQPPEKIMGMEQGTFTILVVAIIIIALIFGFVALKK